MTQDTPRPEDHVSTASRPSELRITDLRTAEMLAFPLLFIISLFVFRGLIAAGLPLLIGGITIPVTFALISVYDSITDLSVALTYGYTTLMPAAKGSVVIEWSKIQEQSDSLRAEYSKDIDILHLASELVIDAIVQPEDLRAELIRRFALAAGKDRQWPEKRNPITPV